MLGAYLAEKGFEVLSVREPGSTPVSEEIRKCLLKPQEKELSYDSYYERIQATYSNIKSGLDDVSKSFLNGALLAQHIFEVQNPERKKELNRAAEFYLFAGARRPLLKRVVVPHLKKGKRHIVLSDRCALTSKCYQGYGYDPNDIVFMQSIDEINHIATCGVSCDRAVFLDQEPNERLDKTATSEFGMKDRIEQKPLEYHLNVRRGYLDMARQDPERIKIVPFLEDQKEKMHEMIVKHVDEYLDSLIK